MEIHNSKFMATMNHANEMRVRSCHPRYLLNNTVLVGNLLGGRNSQTDRRATFPTLVTLFSCTLYCNFCLYCERQKANMWERHTWTDLMIFCGSLNIFGALHNQNMRRPRGEEMHTEVTFTCLSKFCHEKIKFALRGSNEQFNIIWNSFISYFIDLLVLPVDLRLTKYL